MRRLSCLIAVLIFLCLAGCASQGGNGTAEWPTQDWPVSSPAEQSVDGEKLEEMLAYIEETGLDLHSLLVVRNGEIILEQYYPPYNRNSKHELYSVTKSFTSTLVGIALDQGKIAGLDQPVSAFFDMPGFANPSPEKESLNLEDLLTMTSGLAWIEGDPTYVSMYRSPDWVDYVMDLPMEDHPGETFLYCSGCSHVLSAAVEEAVEMDGAAFARKYLFSPLGIRSFNWETDSNGIPIGGWGLNLTPRDMAKLGYLYLRGGQWEDQQVVSEEWIQQATSKQVATDGDLGYGFQWWTYPRYNAYTALGRYGQTIFVLPDLDMVVVTTAQIDGHDPIFYLIDEYIVPAAQQD